MVHPFVMSQNRNAGLQKLRGATMKIDRREFLKLAGIGGVVVLSPRGLLNRGEVAAREADDFFLVQLSDTHWGFAGPAINPDAAGTLKKAVEAVNSLKRRPDFIMFTGDLTHTTDDDGERRKRLSEFREITSRLTVKGACAVGRRSALQGAGIPRHKRRR